VHATFLAAAFLVVVKWGLTAPGICMDTLGMYKAMQRVERFCPCSKREHGMRWLTTAGYCTAT
jgi:hypothetical protein